MCDWIALGLGIPLQKFRGEKSTQATRWFFSIHFATLVQEHHQYNDVVMRTFGIKVAPKTFSPHDDAQDETPLCCSTFRTDWIYGS